MPHFSPVEVIALIAAVLILVFVVQAVRYAQQRQMPSLPSTTARRHTAVYSFKRVDAGACFWLGAFLGGALDLPNAWNVATTPQILEQSQIPAAPFLLAFVGRLLPYIMGNAIVFTVLAVVFNLMLRWTGGFPIYFEVTRDTLPATPPPAKPYRVEEPPPNDHLSSPLEFPDLSEELQPRKDPHLK